MDNKLAAIDAMELIFQLHETIDKNGLSIADLMDVIDAAVESGDECMSVTMAMVSNAFALVEKQRANQH